MFWRVSNNYLKASRGNPWFLEETENTFGSPELDGKAPAGLRIHFSPQGQNPPDC